MASEESRFKLVCAATPEDEHDDCDRYVEQLETIVEQQATIIKALMTLLGLAPRPA